jgi:hypothetical protein
MSTYMFSDTSSTTFLVSNFQQYRKSGIGGAGNFRKTSDTRPIPSTARNIPTRTSGVFLTGIGGQVTAVASKSVQSSLKKKNWLVARLEEVVLPQVGITALVVREIGQIPLTPRVILQVHRPDSRTRRHLYLAVRID